MRLFCVIVLLASHMGYAGSWYWGQTGHRVIGEVASQHLDGKTKRKIKQLLGGKSLALVATYADEIKSDERFKGFSPWHYVNFPFDSKYKDQEPSPHGDLIMGIEKCISVLKSDRSSKEDKAFYLMLLVHFIGDLHQPLHVGRGEDKGGNDIQVQWFGKGSNLHRVWDGDMINQYGMSYTELTENLPVLTRTQIKELQKGELIDWVYESQQMAKKVYASAKTGEKLRYRYMYDHFGTVKEQLQKGGLRLAKVLNTIF